MKCADNEHDANGRRSSQSPVKRALEVQRETARLGGLGYDLEVTGAALEFLIGEGFDAHFGARPLRKTIERHLQDAVLRNLFAAGCGRGRITADPAARRLTISN